jgi:hypothetical protein
MTKRYQRGHHSIYGFWWPRWYLLVIVLSVLLWFTAFDNPFGIFWSLCWPSFFDLRLLMTPLVSFGHCVVRPSSIYGCWWPRWYLLVIVLSVLHRFTAFDDPVGIFWSLCCPSFFDLRLLMTPLVSFGHCVVRPSSIGQHNDQKIPTGSSKAVNRWRTDNTRTKRYQRGHQKP